MDLHIDTFIVRSLRPLPREGRRADMCRRGCATLFRRGVRPAARYATGGVCAVSHSCPTIRLAGVRGLPTQPRP